MNINISELLKDLRVRPDEQEWFEFKENWFDKSKVGMYVSALSNGAAISGKTYGYLIWGINDKTKEIIGTNINFYCDYQKEPFQNHLARNLYPSIAFEFIEAEIESKRVVVLIIPAANKVPTAYRQVRYTRIGSSLTTFDKYPERESLLWRVLIYGYPTMINTESPIQDLTFKQLKLYYLTNKLLFNDENFITNMHLLTSEGKFNMLACFLADNGEIPVRVSMFTGSNKASPLYSVKEFGNQSLVSVIDRIIEYANSINIPKSNEDFSTGVRKDIPLFDQECFNEAVKNSFIHNSWLRKTPPMITFFNNKVEITSFSSLAPGQTVEGFFKGNSIPVNEELSSIFLATHLSERTGKGNPLIVSRFGRRAFKINEFSIKVTIKYNWIYHYEEIEEKAIDKTNDNITKVEIDILREIIRNPKSSQPEIAKAVGVSKTKVQIAISKFKKIGIIDRINSNKNGYWKVNTNQIKTILVNKK